MIIIKSIKLYSEKDMIGLNRNIKKIEELIEGLDYQLL